jgi:hypothetical protein
MAAILLLVINLRNLQHMFLKHQLLKGDQNYKEIGFFDQFHTTMGLWNPIIIVRSFLTLVATTSILLDDHILTQLPANATLCVFGASAAFSVASGLRYIMQ